MDPSRLMTSTCTLVRVTQTVDAGDIEETTTTESSACLITPQSTTEAGGRVVVDTEKWQAFLPASVDLASVDRVIFDGDTFELDGRPTKWPAVGGISAFVQASLVRTA